MIYRIFLQHRNLRPFGRCAGRRIDATRKIYVLNGSCNRLINTQVRIQ
jgi:hypothetical protein